ncbi:MAG: VTT domain-containing protein [Candidatus Pacebacteria bacterium]|nr:VTT domain-containing protein [Candidatus Paceibacterota bacterium]
MLETLLPFIKTAGYVGLFLIVFAESGLLIGVIFPGDTLLFAAGLMASKGFFNIELLLLVIFVAAVTGDSFGYWLGKKFGRKLFNKEESFFFKHEYIDRAQHFFEKHGKKTIFLSRYIPIVRTFAPVLAGVGQMEYKGFLFYNVIGGLAWTLSLGLTGYFLGEKVPNIDAYILPIILGIVVLSFLPVIKHYIEHVLQKRREAREKENENNLK